MDIGDAGMKPFPVQGNALLDAQPDATGTPIHWLSIRTDCFCTAKPLPTWLNTWLRKGLS